MKDLHKKWAHRWLNKKAKAKNSKIHGLGVFAVKNIKKGEYIAVLGGIVVPRSEVKKYWKIMGHVGIQIDDNFFIVPTTRKELEEKGVFNHSCSPNIGFKNIITFMAIKDIKSGEELLFDYAFCEMDKPAFKCNCGSKNCRKIIKPTDWKDKNLREKYKKYFSPYVRDKF